MGQGCPCHNYHACLQQIVRSLKLNQGNHEPIREWICIGDNVLHWRCFFQVVFMIGDSQSQDKMCGRYLAYANMPRMCWAFDVTIPIISAFFVKDRYQSWFATE